MRETIWQRLHADEVDHEELYDLISSHFGGAQSDGRGLVGFPDLSGAHLSVRFRDDKLAALEGGPNYRAEDVDAIQRAVVDSLLRDQIPKVAAGIAFATRPTTASYRAPEGLFQIVPAPENAPRPPAIIGQHPLIIEYPITTSPDPFVTSKRLARGLTRWAWFLNATLTDNISVLSGRSRNMWVICPDWTAAQPRVDTTWGQEYYAIDGFNAMPGTFSDAELAMAEMPDDEYYSRRGIGVLETLSIPESFPSTVRCFVELEDSKRDKFLRAAQWRAVANELWNIHMSSWYIAQVAAIETLAFEAVRPNRCPTCQRDLNQRPTAVFKNFLDKYAPGSGPRSRLDALYQVRSGLVHGGSLLHHDTPFSWGYLTFASDEREKMDLLTAALSVAMVNWLRAQ